MKYTDYSELLPLEPPEGAVEYCQSKGKLVGDLLIYEAAYITNPITEQKEEKVKVKCTACGETYYLDYVLAGGCSRGYRSAPFGFFNYDLKTNVISSDTTRCPECGAPAEAKYINNFYKEYWPLSSCKLTTVEKVNGIPILTNWKLELQIYRSGAKEILVSPWEAYVFERKRCLKYTKYRYWWSNNIEGEWILKEKCIDTYGKSEFVLPFKKDLLNDTVLENSKLDIFAKSKEPYMLSYLRLYQRHSNVENLVMQGFSESINYRLSQTGGGSHIQKWSSNIEGIDWTKKRPHEMLGVDIETYRIAKSDGWNLADIDFYREHKTAKGWDFLTPELIKTVKAYSTWSIEQLITRNMPVVKILRYLDKQREKYPDNKSRIDIRNYLDYLDTCEDLEIDITKTSTLYPKNLNDRHDAVTKQQKFKESEELNRKFFARQEYLDNFAFETDGLLIRSAKSQKELIEEGEALDHCVARYADRHANGDTTIFFIRKADEPDTSFFTLEFDFKTNTVRQNRGRRNCARTDEVKAFEEKWLSFVNKKIKELKKNGKSVNAA